METRVMMDSQIYRFCVDDITGTETPPPSAMNQPREPLLITPAENGDPSNDGFWNRGHQPLTAVAILWVLSLYLQSIRY